MASDLGVLTGGSSSRKVQERLFTDFWGVEFRVYGLGPKP